MVTYGKIGTFVHSSVTRTFTVSNVNIDIPMMKQESSRQRVWDFRVKRTGSIPINRMLIGILLALLTHNNSYYTHVMNMSYDV